MEIEELDQLVKQSQSGDFSALASVLEYLRPRLERMLTARMDSRMASRIDVVDIIQEVYVEAQRRIGDYDADTVPFIIWLRSIAGQRLIDLQRFHLGAERRAVSREAAPRIVPDASSVSLAHFFVSKMTSVSQAALRTEVQSSVRAALEMLEPSDREIVSRRHLEQLTNEEVAAELGINPSTASTRHLRALKRLKAIFTEHPGLSALVEAFG